MNFQSRKYNKKSDNVLMTYVGVSDLMRENQIKNAIRENN